jgi:flagellar basal body-associated protein FliL
MQNNMRGSALTIIIIIAAIIAVVGMAGFIFFKSSNVTQIPSSTASNTSTAVSPAVPIKDYAPNLPMSQKTTILIQTSDSSDIKYIVPTTQVSTYVKSLPPGYHVVSPTP